MRVTRRLDQALRALVELARLENGQRMAVSGLSERLGLSKRVLEQQITELAKHGMVECRRGARGGCRLARPAGEITVEQVMHLLEGEVLDEHVGARNAVSLMWADIAELIQGAAAAITVADLTRNQVELESETNPIYFI